MVEEFMLLANKIVAEEINEYEKKYNKRYRHLFIEFTKIQTKQS